MSEPDSLLGKQGLKKKSFYKLLNFLGHSFVRLVLFFLFSNRKVNTERLPSLIKATQVVYK